jgi:hypothetical protein
MGEWLLTGIEMAAKIVMVCSGGMSAMTLFVILTMVFEKK